jgi:hypothetical protein
MFKKPTQLILSVDITKCGVLRGHGDFILTKEHSGHEAAPLEEKNMLFIERLKECAQNESTSLKEIYIEESQKAD